MKKIFLTTFSGLFLLSQASLAEPQKFAADMPKHPGLCRESVSVAGAKRGRVIILEGCAQPVLKPSINAATRRLLARHGYESVTPPRETCCEILGSCVKSADGVRVDDISIFLNHQS